MTTSPPKLSPRVLSIQSHVISGYVGNKAAVFPLQLLGFDVDILPSVTLSNHTGYKQPPKGLRHTSEQVTSWIQGLHENALLSQITHLLTGYIGTAETLASIVDAIHVLRQDSSSPFVYVCDPVMGDDGRLYVHKDVVQVYIDRVLPLATLLTPNAFELGLLTATTIETIPSAFSACDLLHAEYSIPLIVVTGTHFDLQSDKVSVLVSANRPDQTPLRFALEADYIHGSFTGSGDLLTALLLAWTTRMPDDLVGACKNAMASVTAVLRRTNQEATVSDFCKKPELRLVQSQGDILEPPVDLVEVRMVTR